MSLTSEDIQQTETLLLTCDAFEESLIKKYMTMGECPPCLEGILNTAPPCGKMWVEWQLCSSFAQWVLEDRPRKIDAFRRKYCKCYADKFDACLEKHEEAKHKFKSMNK